MQAVLNLFTGITWTQILMYFMVFAAKLVEVIFATVRVVLINRGEKLKGACIGFVEVLIWITVASQVLGSISEDPLKVIVYALAFSLGNYLGVMLEQKLAIGTASLQVIVQDEEKEALSGLLREKGYGVTALHGEGKDGPVNVLLIFVKRKLVQDAITLIRRQLPGAIITVNDVRQLRNGYMPK